jgi:hypothetical protein
VSDGSRSVDILAVGDADVDIYVEVARLPRPGEKIAGEQPAGATDATGQRRR